jgi:hypothetical protein
MNGTIEDTARRQEQNSAIDSDRGASKDPSHPENLFEEFSQSCGVKSCNLVPIKPIVAVRPVAPRETQFNSFDGRLRDKRRHLHRQGPTALAKNEIAHSWISRVAGAVDSNRVEENVAAPRPSFLSWLR